MNRIGLYLDKELKHPVRQREVDGKNTWVLDFGRLDAGEQKVFPLYIENQSQHAIEDLDVSVDILPYTKETVIIIHDKPKRVEANAVHMVLVKWSTKEDSEVGRKTAHITFKGYFVE